jgi:O-antigen/teichoic acid export membrane protein
MDKIMLGVMSNKKEVGFYQSSENLIQVPIALITSLGTVMQPRMSNMISNNADTSKIEDLFKKSIALAMFLSTSLGFGIMTVAQEFVPLFYGNGFEKCIILFYVLLPSCIFIAFANVVRTQYLIPNKKDKEYVISLLSGAAINLVFNTILIPHLQSIGAAIGTLVAESSVCIVQSLLMRREKSVRKYISMSIPFVISGGMMFFIWNGILINMNSIIIGLLVKIIFAGFTYLIVLALVFFMWKCFLKLILD